MHCYYWEVVPGQDISDIDTLLGWKTPTGKCTIPLNTIEAPLPFDETDERHEEVRYFAPHTDKTREIAGFWDAVREEKREG